MDDASPYCDDICLCRGTRCPVGAPVNYGDLSYVRYMHPAVQWVISLYKIDISKFLRMRTMDTLLSQSPDLRSDCCPLCTAWAGSASAHSAQYLLAGPAAQAHTGTGHTGHRLPEPALASPARQQLSASQSLVQCRIPVPSHRHQSGSHTDLYIELEKR